ncbi:MAG TPA: hypothetical protein VFA11_01005 [Acidimicrobiales bacterium]|nr:hypothetical protein [Acidimicrobiales bacterium]
MRAAGPITRWWGDAGLRFAWILVALAGLGFVLMAVAWRRSAGFSFVPPQVAPLVAATVGLALVGLGSAGLAVHLGRREDAAARAAADRQLDDAVRLAQLLAERRAG